MAIRAPDSELQALLERERACCGRLESILEAERAAAAAYDHAALLACLKARELLDAEWRAVSAERCQHLAASGVSLAMLAGGDDDVGRLVDEIRRTGSRVRRAQRVNEGVVQAALRQVTDLLAAIQRQLPESRYDRQASLTTPRALGRGAGWSA